MKSDRITRVNELIRRELATQVYRVVREPDFDPAELTFTRVETAVDLRTARVCVSIRGDAARREQVMGLLRRHRVDFQHALRDHVVLRYTPHLHFTLDLSIEKGQQVLEILDALALPEDGGGDGAPDVWA